MNDPAWAKVHDLTNGYPAEFNAGAAYELVMAAWRMGFDIVKAPDGSKLYEDAIKAQAASMRNVSSNR